MNNTKIDTKDKSTTCWNCFWEGLIKWCVRDREHSDKGVQDVLCCPKCGKVLFRLGVLQQ